MDEKDGEIEAGSGGLSLEKVNHIRALARASILCGAGSLVLFTVSWYNILLYLTPVNPSILAFGLVIATPFTAGAGVVAGHSARFLCWWGGGGPAAKRTAALGLLSGYGVLLLWVLTVPALMSEPRSGVRKSCQNNLKQHSLVQKVWAYESMNNLFPALSAEPGRLFYAMTEAESSLCVFPEFIPDVSTLYCPEAKKTVKALREVTDRDILLADHSYFYLSHAVLNDREMAAFADAYRKAVTLGPKALNEDFVVPAGSGNNGGDRLLRLREEMRPLLAGAGGSSTDESGHDVLSRVPVLIERLGNHKDPGGHVLYLDGHVEFVPYPGPFPMTKETVALLESLDALGPPPIGKTRAAP